MRRRHRPTSTTTIPTATDSRLDEGWATPTRTAPRTSATRQHNDGRPTVRGRARTNPVERDTTATGDDLVEQAATPTARSRRHAEARTLVFVERPTNAVPDRACGARRADHPPGPSVSIELVDDPSDDVDVRLFVGGSHEHDGERSSTTTAWSGCALRDPPPEDSDGDESGLLPGRSRGTGSASTSSPRTTTTPTASRRLLFAATLRVLRRMTVLASGRVFLVPYIVWLDIPSPVCGTMRLRRSACTNETEVGSRSDAVCWCSRRARRRAEEARPGRRRPRRRGRGRP